MTFSISRPLSRVDNARLRSQVSQLLTDPARRCCLIAPVAETFAIGEPIVPARGSVPRRSIVASHGSEFRGQQRVERRPRLPQSSH